MAEFQFFNPYDDICFTANRLPHWQQKGAVYFVTFRLADAVPQHLRDKWESDRETWLRFHPSPWDTETEREYHERFSGAIERCLMRVTARAFCDVPNARQLLRKRCVTLIASEFRKLLGS